MTFARPILAASLIGAFTALSVTSTDVCAQQVYRIVGPDGRVTFSDKPPLETSSQNARTVSAPTGATADNSALPFELRQVANRYPVTLYTAPGCGACATGRAMLSGRGIPFSEKTVTSNDDIEAFKRLATAGSLPLLTIGGQQINGFSEAEWTQFLDAAGYPKSSQLPAGYRPAPAAPLVAAQPLQAPTRAAASAPAPRATAPAPAAEPADNPAGIKF